MINGGKMQFIKDMNANDRYRNKTLEYIPLEFRIQQYDYDGVNQIEESLPNDLEANVCDKGVFYSKNKACLLNKYDGHRIENGDFRIYDYDKKEYVDIYT